MSPSYERITNVPHFLRELIRKNSNGDYQRLVQLGFGFRYSEDGGVEEITPYEDLPQDLILDARRETSRWHIVRPIYNSSRRQAHNFQDKLEGQKLQRHSRKYRGNHSSITRGAGLRARNRISSGSKYRHGR